MSNNRLTLAGIGKLNNMRHHCRSALRLSAGSAARSGTPVVIELDWDDASVIVEVSL